MEIILLLIAALAISCMLIFRKDFKKTHTSILDDRFFLTLIICAITTAIALSVPIWIDIKYDFSPTGYDNFLSYFKLPIGIIGLTATIAAAYGFHHNSKQKQQENQILITNLKIQTANEKIEELDKIFTSASLITICLIKLSNNVYVLIERLLGNQFVTTVLIRHDIDIIEKYWNELYQNDRFAPAIINFNRQLQDIDGHLKGMLLLATDISEKIQGSPLIKIPTNEKTSELKSKTDLIREDIKKFENDVVEFNRKYRKNRDEWAKYRADLEQIILNGHEQPQI